MSSLGDLYHRAMETELPDDELVRELFTHFTELRPDQQKDIAELPEWHALFLKRQGIISSEVRDNFRACLSALEVELGGTISN